MKIGDQHECKPNDYSQGRIEVVGTHDGPSWHLDSMYHIYDGDSEPIGWCPWCGKELI